ncbi:putative O-glycosylation ligase, exosortase A system-associated [Elioraea rosea]|uniref:putative O-glycosylation ligase, exosortase A system-associated n=1 Tax=Elioraea rosea TaxID=2492390 RepID=UPI0011870E3B|nr:putative O-glycosylation ligase, exosortase A system-associated [Elioraea rosea]
MRDLALSGVLVSLLALAAARPFVGVLVWSWISFMNPHREVWGFAQSMPWAMVTFLVTVFACFVAREPKRLALNAVTVLLVVFAFCITVTSLVAIGPSAQVWEGWNRTIKVLAGLLLTASLLTERRRVDALVWLMVIAIGFYGVKGGIFTAVTGGGFIVLGPPDSMIEDRNHLAVALLVTLPLMNYLRMQARHLPVRQGLAAAMAATLLAAIGSQSRGALIALAATAGMFWLRSRGKITSGIVLAVGLAAAIAFMPESWVERMRSIQNYEQDGSAMGRLTIWMAAFALALARPLVGGGFHAIYNQGIVNMVAPGIRARATHSIWFEVMADHGFPTFFVWVGIIVAGLWYSRRICRMAKDQPALRWAYDLARMSQVSAVAYMAGGSFLSLSYWDFFWTLMVVLGATHALVAQALRQQSPAPAAGRSVGWQPQSAGGLRPAVNRT